MNHWSDFFFFFFFFLGGGSLLCNIYSPTPDQEFRCFNTCEIILSHILYQPVGKIEKQPHAVRTSIIGVDPCRDYNVKMTPPCQTSEYSGLSGSLIYLIVLKIVQLSGAQKLNNPLFI